MLCGYGTSKYRSVMEQTWNGGFHMGDDEWRVLNCDDVVWPHGKF
jgi:hypothetical protein